MAKDLLGTYFNYLFPEPQYLGAKYIHRGWISQYIPEDTETVLDAFSGSQSIAFMMKQLGKKTLTNDFLNFNYLIGKALVENSKETINPDDVSVLFSANSNPAEYNLMEKLFSCLFFTDDECQFIDAFRSNVHRLGNPYKSAMALAMMCRSLTRKVTMGHFAHTQALFGLFPEKDLKID